MNYKMNLGNKLTQILIVLLQGSFVNLIKIFPRVFFYTQFIDIFSSENKCRLPASMIILARRVTHSLYSICDSKSDENSSPSV